MATVTKSSNARKSSKASKSKKSSKAPKVEKTFKAITEVIQDLAKEEAKVETPKSSSRKSKKSGAKAKPEVKTEPKVDTHSGTSEKEESRIHDAVVTLVNKFGDKLNSMHPTSLNTLCSALKIRTDDLTPVRLNRAASELRDKREKWEEKVKEENKNGHVKTVLNGKLPGKAKATSTSTPEVRNLTPNLQREPANRSPKNSEGIRTNWLVTLGMLAKVKEPVKIATFRLESKEKGGIETDHSFNAMESARLITFGKIEGKKTVIITKNGLEAVKKS